MSETARVREIYNRNAARFDRGERWEWLVIGRDTRSIVAEARGKVLELAVGTGHNLSYYRAGVELKGIEISERMLERAQARARELGIDADLRVGDAQDLPFADGSFDTVVCTFSLCTIPDDRAALTEARRVLLDGGLLLLAEHVRSPNPIVQGFERALEPLMIRAFGDHLTRDPLDHLEQVGFAVERVERSRLGFIERLRAYKT